MAKISALPYLTAAEADGTEVLPLVKGGSTFRAPAAEFIDRLAGPYVASAEAASGPTYASLAAGLAASINGQSFTVDNGDGTISVYRKAGGVGELQREVLTPGALRQSRGARRVGFSHDGDGAAHEEVETALRRVGAWPEQFGAVGDGEIDDTDNFTRFWIHAIENPGMPHYLPAKTYCISAPLPTINASNVWIEGWGSELHDTGQIITGSVIKWIGGSAPGATMVTVAPDPGAEEQRLSGVFLRYIGLDCNYGAAGEAIDIKSLQESDIDLTICNPGQNGMVLDVVPALGEAKDLQRNTIRLNARCLEARNGVGLRLKGVENANVSLNSFDIDIVHRDAPAIVCENSDNNAWWFVRLLCLGDGAATKSIVLQGGPTVAASARGENFWFFSSNRPPHAEGTELWAAPSIRHRIYYPDLDNNTPLPTAGTGAIIEDPRWRPYAPTVTASGPAGGGFSANSGIGQYRVWNGSVDVRAQWTVATPGDGYGSIAVPVPIPAALDGLGAAFVGKERALTGQAIIGFIDGGQSAVYFQRYDGLFPAVAGGVYSVSGSYRYA